MPWRVPEIDYSDGVPIPPNVRPLIVVSGSEYDMGYQWYQQIVQIYGHEPLMQRAGKEFTDSQISSLKAYQWYLQEYTPEMISMIKGMVDAANDAGIPLSYEEMLAKWTGTKSYDNLPSGSEDEELPPEDCSGFAVWGSATKDGKLIASGNGDHQMEFGDSEINDFEYTVAMFPEEGNGNNLIIPNSTGGVWHGGMNNKGVVNFHHGTTGYCGRFGAPQAKGYGVPKIICTLHTLRFANSADEAKDIMLSLPTVDGRSGGAWADINGNAFVIENRDDPRVIRYPGDVGETDFIYSTNNLLSKELGYCMNQLDGDNVYIPHAGWHGMCSYAVSGVDRNLGMWNMFHNYHGEIDLDFVKMVRRFPGEPPAYSTLEEAEAQSCPTMGKGWDQKICTQCNAMVAIMVPDDGDEGLYLVSNGCPAREAHALRGGGDGMDDAWYTVDATNNFYELELASNPENVAISTMVKAHYALRYADIDLDKLNPIQNYSFFPLTEQFNEALIEWWKGEYYKNLASQTEGNESVLNWAKAIRYYTRCQCLAKQVTNYLVPPATSPEDLGLRPYGGTWGEWATE